MPGTTHRSFVREVLAASIPVLVVFLFAIPANSQTINTYAGDGVAAYSGDGGPAVNAALNHPKGMAIDPAGNIYVADPDNYRIRMINTFGMISTYAGNGVDAESGDGGLAANASFSDVMSVARDPQGNLYVADSSNRRIRKISPLGIVTSIAGIGIEGFSGDGGPAVNAMLGRPVSLVLDPSGNLYFADSTAQRIRKIDATGIISTVAGNGLAGFSGDGGSALSASFNFPLGVALDATGNIYVADGNNNRIRKITPGGIISTVVGNGNGGFSGDGGNASSAALNIPSDVTFDLSGNMYIADAGNNRVRVVNPSGVISTIAGTDNNGYSGDGGSPTQAMLNYPWGVAVDVTGAVYIGDRANCRVRTISSAVSLAPPSLRSANPIVNGASFAGNMPIAAGSIVTLFGSNLSYATVQAQVTPLPTSLAQTSVTFNGVPAPLYYVSQGQINVQVPFTIAPGLAEVQVTRGTTSTQTQAVSVTPFSPGIFQADQNGTGVIFHGTTFTFITPSSPAKPGEVVSIYCTGLGAVMTPATAGAPAQADNTVAIPTVMIGGQIASTSYSGLAPGLIGVYQVNATVPSTLTTGMQPVQIIIGGVPGNQVFMSVSR